MVENLHGVALIHATVVRCRCIYVPHSETALLNPYYGLVSPLQSSSDLQGKHLKCLNFYFHRPSADRARVSIILVRDDVMCFHFLNVM